MPEEPIPMMATFFPLKSYDASHSAECINFPSYVSMPGIDGHLQLLVGRKPTRSSKIIHNENILKQPPCIDEDVAFVFKRHIALQIHHLESPFGSFFVPYRICDFVTVLEVFVAAILLGDSFHVVEDLL